MNTQWLEWGRRLQALAQNGLTYTENPYDVDRYRQIQQITADMMAAYTDTEPEKVLNFFRHERGYATPKVDARGAVFQDGKILLVKERSDGGWTLPGGWVDVGEPPSLAIEREVFEESGYQTKATKLLALYDRDHPRHGHPPLPVQIYKLFFRCELIGGSPTPSIETEAVDFFAPDQIPELSLSRVVPSQIDRLFQHETQPDLPTDFD
ncbi:NUDIX hydrolase [Leptolyngbya sp. GB1-A1]|uniref:NUDIX hydrolase n=1 Tax=Leptolyngbya sp. GB1-A1 TaxID=2933908 RepID=UPI00329763CF